MLITLRRGLRASELIYMRHRACQGSGRGIKPAVKTGLTSMAEPAHGTVLSEFAKYVLGQYNEGEMGGSARFFEAMVLSDQRKNIEALEEILFCPAKVLSKDLEDNRKLGLDDLPADERKAELKELRTGIKCFVEGSRSAAIGVLVRMLYRDGITFDHSLPWEVSEDMLLNVKQILKRAMGDKRTRRLVRDVIEYRLSSNKTDTTLQESVSRCPQIEDDLREIMCARMRVHVY